ncbi:MAG TPA: CvpA family protein, partial [Chitinolyticbacter sp.]|nr:CvpA family protein [Chitinolyticbacter sp.]
MTAFDYVVLAVLGASVLLSVMRGLTQEVMALIAWVL